MKRIHFIALLLVCFAFSCKTRNSKIQYGLLGCYQLTGDEKEISPTQADVALFNTKLNPKKITAYINKMTAEGPDKTYITFVLEDLPDQIREKVKQDSSYTHIEEKTKDAFKTTYYIYKMKKQGLLANVILFKPADVTNSLLVYVISETEEAWNNVYANTDMLIDKLNCKNEIKK